MEFLSSPELASQATALGQVLLMDLVLAGDNAVAVGLAAAALPQEQRKKAILIGLAAAVVMRIGFALITVLCLAFVIFATSSQSLSGLRDSCGCGGKPKDGEKKKRGSIAGRRSQAEVGQPLPAPITR